MADRPRVVVVDGPTETAQVLQAVLQRRGWCVQRVRRLDAADDVPRPNVVVVDLSVSDQSEESFHKPRWQDVPWVVISESDSCPSAERAGIRWKPPFQYADLVQAIEWLVTRHAEKDAA